MTKLNIQVELELPQMPEFLRVKTLKADSLDQAIASGEKYTVDVGELTAEAVDQFIQAGLGLSVSTLLKGCAVHDYYSAQRDYIQAIQAIQPYLDQKYKIYSSVNPKLTIFPDGTVEHEYDFTNHQQELLRILDEAINLVKNNFNWKKYDY